MWKQNKRRWWDTARVATYKHSLWTHQRHGNLPHTHRSSMASSHKTSHTLPLTRTLLSLLLPHNSSSAPTNPPMASHHAGGGHPRRALVLQPGLPVAPGDALCSHGEASRRGEAAGGGYLRLHAWPWEGAHRGCHGHCYLRHGDGLPLRQSGGVSVGRRWVWRDSAWDERGCGVRERVGPFLQKVWCEVEVSEGVLLSHGRRWTWTSPWHWGFHGRARTVEGMHASSFYMLLWLLMNIRIWFQNCFTLFSFLFSLYNWKNFVLQFSPFS